MLLNDIGNLLVLRSNPKVLPGISLSQRALIYENYEKVGQYGCCTWHCGLNGEPAFVAKWSDVKLMKSRFPKLGLRMKDENE